MIIGCLLNINEILQITGIGQLIKIKNFVVGILLYKSSNYMRANESCTSGNENFFHERIYQY